MPVRISYRTGFFPAFLVQWGLSPVYQTYSKGVQ